MKFTKQKFISLFLTLTLVILPTQVFAAKTKVHHRVTSISKSAVNKTSRIKVSAKQRVKSNNRTNKMRVSLRKQSSIKTHSFSRIQTFDHLASDGLLQLASLKALIVNQDTGETIYAKGTNIPTPIASVTKLMTAMVMLDAKLPMTEILTVSDDDVDYLKGSSSKLPIGTRLSRIEMLQLALMASENRAASALGRNYPGGKEMFVRMMNAKALELGMASSHFADPTGLDSGNVSTAEDLVHMVKAAYQYIDIRRVTTTANYDVYIGNRNYPTNFHNTNGLVREGNWEIGLSKTGYISEAGRCLVMQAMIAGQPMIIVLLDSNGKMTRIGDANRVRRWIEANPTPKETVTGELMITKKISG
ncbi:MAG: D-alanyl-D-alanine endopeptidase [Methylophilaceae bacterium]|nr:D-alanyl-D-alanine endopeptidase [Methylophilaceae bacterium]